MKMQKIDENKIKIILNSQDLAKNNINIKSFSSTSNEVKKLILHICDIAKNNFNFNLNTEKTVIDILPLENDFLIMILSTYKNNISSSSINKNNIFYFQNSFDFFKFYIEYWDIIKEKKYLIYIYLKKLYIIVPSSDIDFKNKLFEFAKPINLSEYTENILIEYGQKIK